MTEHKGPQVEECVSSVMEDNPDMDESTAYAICVDEFGTEKLLSMKAEMGLSESEFIEALHLLTDGAVPQTLGAQKADPSEISVDDWVAWDWQGETVTGRVTGGARESRTASGNEITGEDGEADVFAIEEWEEETGNFQSRVAKPASSLRVLEGPPDSFEEAQDDEGN